MGAFESEYERWLADPSAQTEQSTARLASLYPETWQNGDLEDRYSVLGFLQNTADRTSFNLILEALQGLDEGLASHAAAVAFSLGCDGQVLDEDFRAALENFGRRFPAHAVIAAAALDAIDNRHLPE